MDTSSDAQNWISVTRDMLPHKVIGGKDKTTGQDKIKGGEYQTTGQVKITGEDKTTGKTVYVGRGKYDDCLLPGKVYKGAHGLGLYVAYYGKEHFVKKYEVLVMAWPTKWVPEKNGGCPLKAILGGTNAAGNTLYIARAEGPDGSWCPGYLYTPDKRCVYSFEGNEYKSANYEVLAEED